MHLSVLARAVVKHRAREQQAASQAGCIMDRLPPQGVLKEHNPEFNSLDNYVLEPKLRAREEAGARHLERKVLALQEAC